MKDRSEYPLHHERRLLRRSYTWLRVWSTYRVGSLRGDDAGEGDGDDDDVGEGARLPVAPRHGVAEPPGLAERAEHDLTRTTAHRLVWKYSTENIHFNCQFYHFIKHSSRYELNTISPGTQLTDWSGNIARKRVILIVNSIILSNIPRGTS